MVAVALGDLIQHFTAVRLGTDTAGRTFSAGFIHGKFQEEFRDVYHTGVFVHDDQTAGAHHGTDRDQVVIVDRGYRNDKLEYSRRMGRRSEPL